MHPAMCGATGLVLISTINCIFLSSLSLLAQLRMTGGCCHHPASSDFIFSVHSTRLLPGMLCTGLGDEKGRRVCV